MSHDARAAFNRATELHRQGKFDEAIEIYRRLGRAQPNAFEIQRLLTFAQMQAGQSKEAIATARRARETHPSSADAHVLMGAALQVNRQWERALAAFEAALVLDPNHGEAHYLAGNALAVLGRHGEAVERYGRVLGLDPRATEALANRAAALSSLGRHEEALRDCESLIAMQPWAGRHWIAKAGVLLDLGRFAEATATADEAARLEPKAVDAHLLRGQGLDGQCRFEEARTAFNAALACAPQRIDILARLAALERHRGQPERAAAICDTALALDPDCGVAFFERGEARRELGDLAGAVEDADANLARNPEDAPALTLKAQLLADLGEAAKAASCGAAAYAADPHYPLAVYLKASDDLAHGRWTEGWARYESRAWFSPPPYEALPFRRWQGEEEVDELIVVGEVQLSELLLFARMLRLLADRGVPTRLLTAPRHRALLGRVDARVPVICDLSQVDVNRPGLRWVPLGSLPGLICPDPAQWPRPPYLTAEPDRVARWRAVADDDPARLRIGICWQEDPAPTVDGGRAVPLEAFAPLVEMAGVSLVSLQSGAGASALDTVSFGGRIVRLDEGRDADGSFVDTAGLLQHLDLVVSADTALCHLAGARGRPTFVALRAVPDWCWGLSGEETPLYPAMRLFRQRRAGDWSEVFARIAAAVEAGMADRRAVVEAAGA